MRRKPRTDLENCPKWPRPLVSITRLKDRRAAYAPGALEIEMIALVGLLGIALGTAAACTARRFPAHVEAMQTGAGLLLIGGLMLTGCALPVLL